jgi:hypothetical protein
VDVQFEDGGSGIYAAFAPAVLPTPGTPVTISAVTVGGGNATFTFPTTIGRLYRIERAFSLPFWTYLDTVTGDGTIQQVTTAFLSSSANYFRVIELP